MRREQVAASPYGWTADEELEMTVCVATHPALWAEFGHSLNPACLSQQEAKLIVRVAQYAAEFSDGPLRGVNGLLVALRQLVRESRATIEEAWSVLETIWRVEETSEHGSLDNGLLVGARREHWARMARAAAERQATRFLQ